MVAEGCACYSMHSSDSWYCTVMCTVRAVFRLKLSEGWGSDGGVAVQILDYFEFWFLHPPTDERNEREYTECYCVTV